MQRNRKTTKQGLVLLTALLAGSAALAMSYLSQAAEAAPRQPPVYYRTTPFSPNHVPYEAGNGGYGIYRQFLLPDGTVTGPIGPEVNGGS